MGPVWVLIAPTRRHLGWSSATGQWRRSWALAERRPWSSRRPWHWRSRLFAPLPWSPGPSAARA